MSEIEGVTQTTPTPSPQPPASNSDPLLGASLAPTMLELVKEMGAQRVALVEERKEAAKERKSENRWRRGFQLLVFGTPLLYFFFFLSSAGFGLGPFSDVVGVVKVHGEIASGRLASADKIIPALERAFESEHVKAVVLSIDSPGGAPAEAEISQQEIFGAAMLIRPYAQIADAVAAINAGGRPLALYYFGEDADRRERRLA